jgi:hypothetical protein
MAGMMILQGMTKTVAKEILDERRITSLWAVESGHY